MEALEVIHWLGPVLTAIAFLSFAICHTGDDLLTKLCLKLLITPRFTPLSRENNVHTSFSHTLCLQSSSPSTKAEFLYTAYWVSRKHASGAADVSCSGWADRGSERSL